MGYRGEVRPGLRGTAWANAMGEACALRPPGGPGSASWGRQALRPLAERATSPLRLLCAASVRRKSETATSLPRAICKQAALKPQVVCEDTAKQAARTLHTARPCVCARAARVWLPLRQHRKAGGLNHQPRTNRGRGDELVENRDPMALPCQQQPGGQPGRPAADDRNLQRGHRRSLGLRACRRNRAVGGNGLEPLTLSV